MRMKSASQLPHYLFELVVKIIRQSSHRLVKSVLTLTRLMLPKKKTVSVRNLIQSEVSRSTTSPQAGKDCIQKGGNIKTDGLLQR